MKKIFLIVLMVLISVSTVLAFDMSKFALGISFGISGSSERASGDKSVRVQSANTGFTVRLRADYMINDSMSATLMVSYDSPSKTVLQKTYLLSNSEVKTPKYIKIFAGISKYTTPDNLLVAAGVGPELAIDVVNGNVGGGPATYVRTSYSLPGSNILVDSTVKGSAEWIKDMPDTDTHFYLDGDASVGFTYMFK